MKGEKTGGRLPGAPNKKTLILKEVLDELQFDVPRQLVEVMSDLDSQMKAKVLLELMEYIFPKRRAIEHSGPEGEPLNHTALSDLQFQEMKAELLGMVKK